MNQLKATAESSVKFNSINDVNIQRQERNINADDTSVDPFLQRQINLQESGNYVYEDSNLFSDCSNSYNSLTISILNNSTIQNDNTVHYNIHNELSIENYDNQNDTN